MTEILKGIERRELTFDEICESQDFSHEHVFVEASYVSRLERMLLKAIEQRNGCLRHIFFEEYWRKEAIYEKSDAELRAIAEGK
jgi:hypothetical protein